MQNKYIYRLIVLAFIVLSVVACTEEEDYPTYKDGFSTLYSFLEDNEEYSYFKAIVDSATIEGSGQSMISVYSSYNSNAGGNDYTLFLPENQAISDFLVEQNTTLDAFLGGAQECKSFVTHHLLNARIYSSDFPNGELPDTSLSGASHVVRFMTTDAGVSFLIDEIASIVDNDIDQSNGVIHVIDHVLLPLSLTSCEWLEEDGTYDIFVAALKLTGLYDKLQDVDTKRFPFTMFVESDVVFEREGIMSIGDLMTRFSPDNTDYTNNNNNLYQYVAYHALDSKALYITDMTDGNSNYDTFASFPLSVTLASGLSSTEELSDGIGINVGHETFDTIPNGDGDTTFIDYISLYETLSNTPTLSGVIHFINHILEVDTNVTPAVKTFNFHEDPAIEIAYSADVNRNYIFEEDELERFTFGSDLHQIIYYHSDDDSESASNNDYLEISGNYEISFRTTKLTVGDYDLRLRVDVEKSSGLVDVYYDGKKVGTTINLSALDPSNTTIPYGIVTVTKVSVDDYKEHEVTLKSITSGVLVWDYLQFKP